MSKKLSSVASLEVSESTEKPIGDLIEPVSEPIVLSDDEIQQPKQPKRILTPAQKANWEKVQKARLESIAKKKEIKAKELVTKAEQERIQKEKIIMRKAIELKKKELKMKKLLEIDTDEDEPIEQIKQKIVKQTIKDNIPPPVPAPAPIPAGPRFTFF